MHIRVKLRWRGPGRGWTWSAVRPGRALYGHADSRREAKAAIAGAQAVLAE